MRSLLASWMGLAAVLALATGCSSPTCAANDFNCFMDHLSLSENGQPVELVRVPESALLALLLGDAGVPADAPAIQNAPGSLTFDGGWQWLSFNWSDPNGFRPSLCVMCRHATDDPRPCGPNPSAVCTRPKRDLLVKGHGCLAAQFTAQAKAATQFTTFFVAVVSPTGATDPTAALNQAPVPQGLLMGAPVDLSLNLPGGSSGGGGGSCAGRCDSNGICGTCNTQSDCCGSAACISGHSCSKNAVASGCQCDTFSTSGICVDFADFGVSAAQRATTQCSNQTGCSLDFTACCPGQVCVTFSGNVQAPQCMPAGNSVCP